MEGPSLHYLAKELKPFLGKVITKASGNAKFAKEHFVGQKINDLYPFGKRLIIELEHDVLITHFLMYGTYRIDEDRPGMAPRLSLSVRGHTLYFYNCSVKTYAIAHIKEALPLELDILSPNWNRKEVVRKAKSKPNETIDDVLLDQTIFPGVGNIIKNEALALAGIVPTRKVSRISLKKMTELAQHAHEYAQKFLQFYDNWPALRKERRVYRLTICPVCGTKIVRKKTGKRNRWSFYCPHCQK